MGNFYEENFQQYFSSTVDLDPSTFLDPLADLLEPKSTILDIGCGSGRDLLWFARKGFQPTGFEQSPNLAQLAREHTGCSIIEGDFSNFNFSRQTSKLRPDDIWLGYVLRLNSDA